jgi:hypothetical protein
MADKTREDKLNEVHSLDKVYPKDLKGANDEITFDAFDEDGKRIPVTTSNHNRLETHSFFDKAPETTGE